MRENSLFIQLVSGQAVAAAASRCPCSRYSADATSFRGAVAQILIIQLAIRPASAGALSRSVVTAPHRVLRVALRAELRIAVHSLTDNYY